ncbi:Gmad2 immunoglobulin-like domain-containing protein [Nocardia niigatensis]|uniref:Gmad2 immunoglobulin-like domain-containing protein n=1 Tax=Nocardia niigatensis TaxID=209249 RepID=UPI0002D925EA|nr:Gmad2 immunoglobulin-like domain-containing protein [Nocardia niigatensis]
MTTKFPRERWVLIAVLLAVVVVLAAAVLVAIFADRSEQSAPAPPAADGSSSPAGPGAPTGTASPSAAPAGAEFRYEPLWPFHSLAEAASWQQEAGPSGHQPWHLDIGATAQSFTQSYLGFSGVDKVVKVSQQGEQAWASVGFSNPNGVAAVAAVLHLVRMGHGDTAPWEVVGSEDTTLTLTAPAYATAVHPPVTVGGVLTGVDESLRIRILRADRERPVGEAGPIAAGGTGSPWSATVPLTDACPGTLTIVVATGGHVADIERFAVTGVHC